MYKRSKQKNHQSSVEKIQKPKPEWSTDFTDYNKYKLSQAQMIQKKASLQSKNREVARVNLEQRRKKLEMGIIDEDTRKVYQTALLSKNIDINPPIRRNLSQMIQYEKQKKSAMKEQEQYCSQGQQNQDNFQKQIKSTQAFIKKIQKASKQDQIHKAVEILESGSTPRDGKKKNKEYLLNSNSISTVNRKDWISNDNSALDPDLQNISNLEETIKFMEQTLFQKPKSRILKDNLMNQNKISHQVHEQKSGQEQDETSLKIGPYFNFQKKKQQNSSLNFHQQNQKQIMIKKEQNFQISRLELPLTQKDDDIIDNDCMDTIRRMRQMIESKEHLYDYGYSQRIQKQNQPFIIPNYGSKYQESHHDSNDEVDFSLTMNQSNIHSRVKDADYFYKQVEKPEDPESNEFLKIKKSLFQQTNKIKSMSNDSHHQALTVSSIHPDMKKKQKNKESAKKQKKPNAQLEKIKQMINGTKSNVQSLKIEQLKLPKSTDMGFDFRGSINIKKNLAK